MAAMLDAAEKALKSAESVFAGASTTLKAFHRGVRTAQTKKREISPRSI